MDIADPVAPEAAVAAPPLWWRRTGAAAVTRLGQPQRHRGALSRAAFDAEFAARLLGEAFGHRQAKPGSNADGLGGEKREKRLAGAGKRGGVHADAGVGNTEPHVAPQAQPRPVSRTAGEDDLARGGKDSRPPCGIASRALVARLTSAVSSCPLSASHCGRSAASLTWTLMLPTRVWASISRNPVNRVAASTLSPRRSARRLKASRRPVMAAPRSTASIGFADARFCLQELRQWLRRPAAGPHR